jgi:hypothetical protein
VLRLNIDGTVEELGPASPRFAENLLASVVAARLCGIPSEQVGHAVRELHKQGGEV